MDIYWNDRIQPEDINRLIDTQIRLYAMNNQLHKVYSDLYVELNPDFKKYWCVASNVRILLPPFFKTKKQVTFRNRYNLMSEHEIMEISLVTPCIKLIDQPQEEEEACAVMCNQLSLQLVLF